MARASGPVPAEGGLRRRRRTRRRTRIPKATCMSLIVWAWAVLSCDGGVLAL